MDDWDDNDLDAIEDLMSEPPSGGNGGRRVTTRVPSADDPGGKLSKKLSKSLDLESEIRRDFANSDAVTNVPPQEERFYGLVPDRRASDSNRTLTRKDMDGLDAVKIRADVLARLGFTEDDMTHVDRLGAPTQYGRAVRERFEARLLELTESGSAQSDLAFALGWTLEKSASHRMQKALKRARDRRETGDPFSVDQGPAPTAPVAREAGAKCLCGCGRETTLATRTRDGNIKGHPLRYCSGHNSR